MSTENNVTLWAQRADDRYPSTLVLERVFQEGSYDAYVDRNQRTHSHIAVITNLAQRALTAQLMMEQGWVVDEGYEPSPEEIAEREWRERRKRWSVRRIITLSGPLIDECFGEEHRWSYRSRANRPY